MTTDAEAAARPERILDLTDRLNAVAAARISEIWSVNRAAKMLAINALIVAARAGEAGKAFAVVAEEFKKLSGEIDAVAAALDSQLRSELRELSAVGGALIGHMRGQRLADLALNAIEIIDRNLYERTCDVRWWATDSAVVACLEQGSPEAVAFASQRLKVILDAYTVYLDLWICDASGRLIATGRPERYPSTKGLSVSSAPWFTASMRMASGDEFVANDIERARSLGEAPVATYATAIRHGGARDGRVVGVLGIHFDWGPQAQAVVDGVRLSKDERERSRVLLLDQSHRVLAASDKRGVLDETVPLRVEAGGWAATARRASPWAMPSRRGTKPIAAWAGTAASYRPTRRAPRRRAPLEDVASARRPRRSRSPDGGGRTAPARGGLGCASTGPMRCRSDTRFMQGTQMTLLKTAAAGAGVFMLAVTAQAQPPGPANPNPRDVHAGAYTVEASHTRVLFSVSHMGFSTWYGDFSGASGSLVLDPMHPDASQVQITLPVASVSSPSAKLDGELKGADWLDAGQFPTATFRSRETRITSPGHADVMGDLTLHGVTKPLTLHVKFNGAGVNPLSHAYTAGFEARGAFSRSAFGVTRYVPLIGDEVELIISGAFEQKPS